MTNQKNLTDHEIIKWNGKYRQYSYTYDGNIFIIEDFFMPQLNHSTRVLIYVPSDYNSTINRYPVLYMHDGQTVFGKGNNSAEKRLSIDHTLEKLSLDKRMHGMIVVAVESSNEFRRQELNPVRVSMSSPVPRVNEYADFIVFNLKPFIDNNFRTLTKREHTGIAGFSAGAACSIYIGLKFQEVFSKIGAFSLTMIKSFYHISESIEPIFYKRYTMRIYMDVGTRERQGLPDEIRDEFVENFENSLRIFSNKLNRFGFDKSEVKYYIDENGEHTLSDVSRRLPDALLWLYL